jgi:hypothetical protein
MAVPLCKALFFLGKARSFKKTLDKNVILWTETAKIFDYFLFRRQVNDVEGLTGISRFLGAYLRTEWGDGMHCFSDLASAVWTGIFMPLI